MERGAESGERLPTEEAEEHSRTERGTESGERLPTEEAEEHSRTERVVEETPEVGRMEMFSESGEQGRQADETQEQGRTDRETSSGGLLQSEEVQEQWRMERVEEEAPDFLSLWETGQESEEGSEEGWQAEVAQEEERWTRELPSRLQRAAASHERGEAGTAQEIEERGDPLIEIRTEMARLYQMLPAEENRTTQNPARILWQIDLQRMRLGGILSPRMAYQGVNDRSRGGALPASRTAMDSLPSISIQKQQQDDGDAICTVCFEILLCGESAKQMPCSHIYHKDCILGWLRLRNSCPVCRHELPPDGPHDKDQR